jgi:DNA-directed RNA polymerase sigma subunit (sigma70/sigma32)
VAKIEQYGYSVTSLDTPLNDDADMTLGDTVQAPTSLENETVDNLFNEEIKTALWAICETETSKLECAILKETVAKQKTLKQAADTLDISYDDARKLKNRALRRLYKNRKIKRYYNEIDKLDSGAYRGGVNRFKANDFTSVTEYIAIRRTELEKALQKAL